ncbi:hypothetical protein BN424_677 [Carnobacterium maltaromaticum LMA28]|uniref:Uncharacterized protein n=1 Tax=Carnobacterium maltaromaticum LMA28 TaxID=1234679 RepID=K8E2G5_CARML|nr:hypothetical protein BN424_677 [Carnobacterium maltaromaticum LMA28]
MEFPIFLPELNDSTNFLFTGGISMVRRLKKLRNVATVLSF